MVSDLWKIPVRPQSLALRAKETVLKLPPPRRMCCLSRGDHAAAFLRSVPGANVLGAPPRPRLVGFLCRAHYVVPVASGFCVLQPASCPCVDGWHLSRRCPHWFSGMSGRYLGPQEIAMRYEKSKEHLENRIFQAGTMLKKNLNTYEIQDLPSYVYFPVRG